MQACHNTSYMLYSTTQRYTKRNIEHITAQKDMQACPSITQHSTEQNTEHNMSTQTTTQHNITRAHELIEAQYSTA